MKKIFLLLLLLCLKSAVFSQSKYEFGFVLKTGNFTLPSSQRPDGSAPIPSEGSYHQNIGQVYSMGVYQAVPLGKRMRLSTELLYRAVFYSNEELNYLRFFNGTGIQTSIAQTQLSIQQNSLSLPVLLQYTFGKKSKFFLFSGFGLSHVFRANSFTKTSFQGPGIPSETRFVPGNSTGWSNFSYNISWHGGMRFKISPRTSCGLEYVHEKQSAYFAPNPFFEPNPFIDPLFPNTTVYPPVMHSFNLSLQHNIL